MQASKEQVKVVPMINGVEVKVGQIWRDGAGLIEEISLIDTDSPLPIITTASSTYSINGKYFSNYPENHLVQLVKDVGQEQFFTRSELSSLIKFNACEIDFLNKITSAAKRDEQHYYNSADKDVPSTTPYFVKLNSIRNEIKKYKAKKKKLVALQCKLKEMYNLSK